MSKERLQPRTAEQISKEAHARVEEFLAENKKAFETDRYGMKADRLGYLGEERFCLSEVEGGEVIESGSDR